MPEGYALLASPEPCSFCNQPTQRAYPSYARLIPLCNELCRDRYEQEIEEGIASEFSTCNEPSIFEKQQAD